MTDRAGAPPAPQYTASVGAPPHDAGLQDDGRPARSRQWRSLLLVVLFAAVTVVALDFLLGRIAPPNRQREVNDAVAEYEHADPTTLVLGSSHSRTFIALGEELASRTRGAQRLVAVPVEFGKFTSYDWVLRHRLQPLADERDGTGALRRPSLRRFVLLTEWWDGCPPPAGGLLNVPSRGWQLGDFLADARRNGITDVNRNYLQARWRDVWRQSSLVQDRGLSRILLALRDRVLPASAEALAQRDAAFLDQWQRMIENGDRCMGSREQMAGLDDILAFAAEHRLETTIILFPRKPATLTPLARGTTLPQFARQMQDVATRHGARFLDLTTTTPLGDADFMADFDHVTASGNRKFAGWALAGPLAFLESAPDAVAAPGAVSSAAPTGGQR